MAVDFVALKHAQQLDHECSPRGTGPGGNRSCEIREKLAKTREVNLGERLERASLVYHRVRFFHT